jgi:hypothetical protein
MVARVYTTEIPAHRPCHGGEVTVGWRGIVVHPDGRAVSHPRAVSGALRVLKLLGVDGVELPVVWAVAQPGSTAPSQIHRQFDALITKLLDECATTAEERACQGRQVPIARRPASGCGSSPWSTTRCSSPVRRPRRRRPPRRCFPHVPVVLPAPFPRE